MNMKENDTLKEFNIRLGNVEQATEKNTIEIKYMRENDLVHINNKVDVAVDNSDKAKFRSGVAMWLSGALIALLAFGIGTIACLIALN